jgi:lipopolysaccharide transport system ATP-binding protein
MSEFAIRAEGLGKRYRIQQRPTERYATLRETLPRLATAPFRALAGGRRTAAASGGASDFWALRDAGFEIHPGEVVGIIGRNGAGKSTLLKLLSRITAPTAGRIRIRGRLSSLLEVGTGFHPELTGRENVFLNGAILGMSRAELKRKFDEIVAFAEIEQFLETPVKRYSSGMYVRLAFAVAAHLEPEILVVDEVLAVGDAEFQKKSMRKMEEVGSTGQTVLLVSHNMATIQTLCRRALVLERGRIIGDLKAADAVKLYLNETAGGESFVRAPQSGGRPTIVDGSLGTDDLDSRVNLKLRIEMTYPERVALDIRLKDGMGTPVGLGSFGSMAPVEMISLRPPVTEIRLSFPTTDLANGSYLVSMDLNFPGSGCVDRVEDALSFELRRPSHRGALHALPQDWGYGSYELPLEGLEVRVLGSEGKGGGAEGVVGTQRSLRAG